MSVGTSVPTLVIVIYMGQRPTLDIGTDCTYQLSSSRSAGRVQLLEDPVVHW